MAKQTTVSQQESAEQLKLLQDEVGYWSLKVISHPLTAPTDPLVLGSRVRTCA